MLKLWGRTNSINVQKVLITLDELGLAYERFDAGLHHGVVETPDYRAMNPNGVVPTIDEDGFLLWESNVIVRYLAARHGAGGLWPVEPRARAEADRWMDWQQTTFNPPATTLFWSLVRAPDKPPRGDLDAARRSLESSSAIMEAALAERDFLAGASFTMADCALSPSLHRWMHLPVHRPARPRLERYYARLMARPSCAKFLVLPLT